MAGARDVAVFRRADSPDFGSRLFSRDRANKAGRPELRANKAGRIERRIKRVRIKRVGLNCAIPFAPREIAQFRTRFTPFYPDPRNMETSRPSPPHRPRRTRPSPPRPAENISCAASVGSAADPFFTFFQETWKRLVCSRRRRLVPTPRTHAAHLAGADTRRRHFRPRAIMG